MEKEFIEFVKKECKKYGVKCDLRNTNYVKLSDTIKCSGWFDSDSKRLVCSMKRPDSIEVLVHEYSHMTQWSEKLPLWDIAIESLNKIDMWLNGENINDIDSHLSNARDLELDNEKRSVNIIKKWGLDIDIPNYIKKANAYVLFYNYMRFSRKWSNPNNSPYTNKNILNLMSDKFDMNYHSIDSEIQKVFVNENI